MCRTARLGFSIPRFNPLGIRNVQKVICVLNLTHFPLPLLLKQCSIAAAYTVSTLYLALSRDDLMKIKRDTQKLYYFHNEIEHAVILLPLAVWVRPLDSAEWLCLRLSFPWRLWLSPRVPWLHSSAALIVSLCCVSDSFLLLIFVQRTACRLSPLVTWPAPHVPEHAVEHLDAWEALNVHGSNTYNFICK